MGVIRRAWDSPVGWTIVRRASAAAGMAVVVLRLGAWVGQEADPIWALFRITMGVGLLALVAFVGWGAGSALLSGLRISRAYDPPKGDQTKWSGGLKAQHSNRGVLVVDE